MEISFCFFGLSELAKDVGSVWDWEFFVIAIIGSLRLRELGCQCRSAFADLADQTVWGLVLLSF